MPIKFFRILLTGFLLLSFNVLYAQYLPVEMLKGRSYPNYPKLMGPHPTFGDVDLIPNSQIKIYGEKKEGLLLMYDQILDDVVTFHPKFNTNLILPKEYVESFQILGHDFYNLSYFIPGDFKGFYREIYNSSVYRAFVKTKKEIREEKNDRNIIPFVHEKNSYYVFDVTTTKIIEIRDLNSLLALSPNNQSEIRKVLNTEKLVFRNDTELVIQRVLEILDNQ